MSIITEVCCCDIESALAAQRAGANRIELCTNLHENGTTPSYGNLVLVKEQLQIPVHVFIAPRGGNFLYNEIEFQIMLHDIVMATECGADGLVAGCLTKKNELDILKLKGIRQAAGETPLTFHRAFDLMKNPFDAMEQLIDLGFQKLLTSGLSDSALNGKNILKELVQKANGRIEVIASAGINSGNIQQIILETEVNAVHFSSKHLVGDSSGAFSTQRMTSNYDEIKRCVELAKSV